MSFTTKNEMKKILQENPQYQEKLYIRGFLITNNSGFNLDLYPFYGNWALKQWRNWNIITHKDTKCFFLDQGDFGYFLIGHAYNPFTMEYREGDILRSFSEALNQSAEKYWDKLSELTGVFCVGYFKNDSVVFSTDCAGMQLIYYGKGKKYAYITSHSKIFNDFFEIEQMDYIKRLVNSRFYRYWGTWLPGDLSPYKGVYRIQPNFIYTYENNRYSYKRYYPLKMIETVSEDKYEETISTIAGIMRNSLKLIAKKWPNKRAAISVTGGRDSTMTLSSACDVYDELGYFSYTSNPGEKVDAKAANQICNYLGLDHKTYLISDEDKDFPDIEIYRKILECNAGCIGHNNPNDVRKRIYFDSVDDFDVEIKSWVGELSRAEAQNKYNTTKWPKKPSVGYYRCMWKLILNPRLIVESNKVFREYLKKYYGDNVIENPSWMDLFFWEFSWAGGEGVFLTSEHRFSYDITIPYNNRKLLSIMFKIPLNKRLESRIQIDTIRRNNPKIEESGVLVKNLAHTDFWATMIRTYVRIFSKIQL